MTEDEAMTKWCPFVRLADRTTASLEFAYNRRHISDDDDALDATCDPPLRCIASYCMAWRWSDAKRTAAFLDAVQAHMKASPNPNFAKSTQAVYAERGREFENSEGYCGLAGGPE